MLHAYRWQNIMGRSLLVVVLAILVLVLLVSEMGRRIPQCPGAENIRRDREDLDWENVFAFVPVGLKDCADLFPNVDKDEPFDEEFVERRLVFKERIRETYKKVDRRMGHTGKFVEEALVMHTLVKQPHVRTVCETGFNAGHGAFLWLQSNPNVTVFSFDINEYAYVRPMAKFLQKMFPGRLMVTFGDSTVTVPQFHATNPHVTCDVVLIDGGHTYDVARQDYANFRKMASRSAVVIYDNYPQVSMNGELGMVWESAKRRGEISEILRCDYEPTKEQGFSVGRINTIT